MHAYVEGDIFKSRILDLRFLVGRGACECFEIKGKLCGFLCTHVHTISISLGKRIYSFYPINTGICDARKVKNHIKL